MFKSGSKTLESWTLTGSRPWDIMSKLCMPIAALHCQAYPWLSHLWRAALPRESSSRWPLLCVNRGWLLTLFLEYRLKYTQILTILSWWQQRVITDILTNLEYQSKLLGASSEASSPKSLLLEPPQPPTALVGGNNYYRNFVGRLIYHDLYPPLSLSLSICVYIYIYYTFSLVFLIQGLEFQGLTLHPKRDLSDQFFALSRGSANWRESMESYWWIILITAAVIANGILMNPVSNCFRRYFENNTPKNFHPIIFLATKNLFFLIISWAKPVVWLFQTSDFRLMRL